MSRMYGNNQKITQIQGAPMIRVARRVGAFLLDILILFGICAPVGYLVQHLTGFSPKTGLTIWLSILLNFSMPTWLYFLLSDRSKNGKTLGKRLFKLKVARAGAERLGWARAFARTAIKLLPWEIIHFSAFFLSEDLAMFTTLQYIGLISGNSLAFVYFLSSILTQGKRSIHDILVGTEIWFEKF